ncbi:MAG: helix-turn-helix domain-containing protein [Halobacteriota archaeon]
MTSVVTDTSPSRDLRHRYALRVHDLRTEAGLTQQALGAAVGLHRVYVGRLESGVVNFSLDSLEKLLRALEDDPDPRSLTERLAANLKRHRGTMSQESFASGLGLPVLFISRLERQAVTTTIDQVDRLARKLRIDGETLLR